MEAQRINPDSLAKPRAPISQVVRKGSIVAVAGQVAMDAKGAVVGQGDITAQTRQALENVKAALQAAGATIDDVIKATVFLTDTKDFQAMNAVFAEYFKGAPPARSTVRVDLMLPALLVEIEAIAVVG